MKKITLKKILTDQSKDFFLGHCVFINGVMIYTGDNKKSVTLDSLCEYDIDENNITSQDIKKLPEGKVIEQSAYTRMKRHNGHAKT